MADRNEILAYAAEYLDLDSYPDFGPMGLQVAGAREVQKIACGVSASLELFQRAGELEAQLLIVHHGLFWDNDPRVVDEQLRRRLEALFAAGLNLAAYHLALDAHREVGNNALLGRELGLELERPFAKIGWGGSLAQPAPARDIAEKVRSALGQEPVVFDHGPELVERVAVVTGGGGKLITEAAREGYHLFVTGEPEEGSLHAARELGMHFVAGGHYASERMGVQALAAHLAERFELEWEFVELPNPV